MGAHTSTHRPSERHQGRTFQSFTFVLSILCVLLIVKRAFEQRIDRLVRARLYDEARRRRQALEVINEAFHDLQRKERRR